MPQIVFFVTLGSLSYDYSASIIASTLGQPEFLKYFKLCEGIDANATALLGATNGLFQTGGLLGALAIGYCSDRFSRRGSILISSTVLVVGGGFQAGSVLIGSGYALAGWVGYATYPMKGNIQWRLPLALQVVWPAKLITGTYFLPESPRWLLQQDRTDEALAVLKRIHHDVKDPAGNFAVREYHAMEEQFAIDKSMGDGTFKELVTKPHNLKRVVIGFLTMFAAQSTGTLVINNYGVTLYSNVGYSGRVAIALTAGWVTVSILGNYITSLFVDRLGRVRFMIIGFTGITCVLIGEVICLALLETRTSFGISAAAIFFLFGHIAFFSSCIDATTYIYASEIFPTYLRAKGLSLSLSGLFLGSLVYTQAAPSALSAIGWKYYLIFIILSAAFVAVLCLYFPETKNLSLEEIARLFGDPIAVELSRISDKDAEALDVAIESSQASKQTVQHMEKV
ncbi:hypothetical protein DL95DRAFT_305683 [Leptodontidium sp. 2 PMI_412]|nr:hypothetical protein DL95DRAFT_305683 [Leptodontidium sp. 2 PMI_412]